MADIAIIDTHDDDAAFVPRPIRAPEESRTLADIDRCVQGDLRVHADWIASVAR